MLTLYRIIRVGTIDITIKGLLTDMSADEWSINTNSDSSPLSNTETDFSPESSSRILKEKLF